MSTRARIATVSEDLVVSVYCHFDGYPEGLGEVLLKHYDTQEKVNYLLSLGDLSSVQKSLKTCVAYHRDRGEDMSMYIQPRLSLLFEDFESENNDEEYLYLFRDSEWVYKERKKDFRLLKEYFYDYEVFFLEYGESIYLSMKDDKSVQDFINYSIMFWKKQVGKYLNKTKFETTAIKAFIELEQKGKL